MLKIIRDIETELVGRTLIQDEETQKYFIVSSICDWAGDETMIFAANEKDEVVSYSELWVDYPCQHEKVLAQIKSGDLTLEDFYA